MGNPLFGVDISGIIRDNIGPGVLAATLTRSTPGTRTTGDPTGGTNPTEQNFACRGFIDSQAQRDLSGSLVDDGTKIVVLIGDTINGGATVPVVGDTITIEGTVYDIEVIDRDPAAATYTCSVRAA
jgi:predicted secreted protein